MLGLEMDLRPGTQGWGPRRSVGLSHLPPLPAHLLQFPSVGLAFSYLFIYLFILSLSLPPASAHPPFPYTLHFSLSCGSLSPLNGSLSLHLWVSVPSWSGSLFTFLLV